MLLSVTNKLPKRFSTHVEKLIYYFKLTELSHKIKQKKSQRCRLFLFLLKLLLFYQKIFTKQSMYNEFIPDKTPIVLLGHWLSNNSLIRHYHNIPVKLHRP